MTDREKVKILLKIARIYRECKIFGSCYAHTPRMYCDEAIKHKVDIGDAYYEKALCYATDINDVVYLTYLKLAAENGSADAQKTYGLVLERLGDKENASLWMEKSIETRAQKELEENELDEPELDEDNLDDDDEEEDDLDDEDDDWDDDDEEEDNLDDDDDEEEEEYEYDWSEEEEEIEEETDPERKMYLEQRLWALKFLVMWEDEDFNRDRLLEEFEEELKNPNHRSETLLCAVAALYGGSSFSVEREDIYIWSVSTYGRRYKHDYMKALELLEWGHELGYSRCKEVLKRVITQAYMAAKKKGR